MPMPRPFVPMPAGALARGWSPSAVLAVGVALLAAVTSCAAKPVPQVGAAPPPPTYEQKIAAILHLEDRRTLSDTTLQPPGVGVLTTLVGDTEGRVRRRAALAIGRVGLSEGVSALVAALAGDREPEVRAMAAFGLGLIGDAAAAPALMSALGQPDARVQGRAAEALGLIGHKPAAGSVAGMAAAHVKAGAIAAIASDEASSVTPEAEAVRLGVYALARLSAVEELRAVVLGADGMPQSDWWPLAYAMQRVGAPATAPALRAWLRRGGSTTRAFAAKGLGALKDGDARPTLEALAGDERQTVGVRVQAMRALASIGDQRSAAVLGPLADQATGTLKLEAVAALGAVADPAAAEIFVDYLEHAWPPLRSAAQAALARSDPETFMTVLSGLDTDRDWRVRQSLAATLATLPAAQSELRLDQLAVDPDPKVQAAALASLGRLKVESAAPRLLAGLAHPDLGVRLAAARGLAAIKPAGASAALLRAWEASATDTTYVGRAAILEALAAVDAAAAAPLLTAALTDRDWAMRVRAATLLGGSAAGQTKAPARPAPTPSEAALDDTAPMIAPTVSPQAYIATSRGEVRVELAVLEAPRTVANFVALAGRGFFDGLSWHRLVPDFVAQTGDPRGDGEGGPGYTIRDELSQRPYLRGTVGMALDWKDTGGSQFFVTQSPQPHLDARYTVFGHVVEGMDVVDRLEPGDRIDSVRVWDGTRWFGASR